MAASRASPPPPPPPAPGGTTEPRSAQPAPRPSPAGSRGPRPPGAPAPPGPGHAPGARRRAQGSERGAVRGRLRPDGAPPPARCRRHPQASPRSGRGPLALSLPSLRVSVIAPAFPPGKGEWAVPPGSAREDGSSALARLGGETVRGARGQHPSLGASCPPCPLGSGLPPWTSLRTRNWEKIPLTLDIEKSDLKTLQASSAGRHNGIGLGSWTRCSSNCRSGS
ncbi:uncharacterized protein LOC143434634 [Arvicanthis niloticus]|uniref:uncharacterized protein LOC143434634 n=1 Tax=Arvicanthis niloticus TaxID=61156 RepID=UPI00403C2C38